VDNVSLFGRLLLVSYSVDVSIYSSNIYFVCSLLLPSSQNLGLILNCQDCALFIEKAYSCSLAP
jgi:hypothetical protein